jgi:TonB-dependent starch-binding outer membrane protein SusC
MTKKYILPYPIFLRFSLCYLIFCAFTTISSAQTTLKGTVKDEKGMPIEFATILIKGTNKGTTSDLDGRFEVPISPKDQQIEVGYVGFTTETLDIAGQTRMEIVLKEAISVMKDVVVTGYATQQKSRLSTAVASIGNKDFKDQPVTNVASSIQGKISGIQVTSPSGTPGAGLLVSIRGAQNPLYVVDGIPMLSESNSAIATSFDTNGESVGAGQNISSINDINPNDIESIDILKDASAAAIYGARAANGVVLITTKRGKSGETSFNFNAYTGIQQPVRKIPFMSSEQFIAMINEARSNDLARYKADKTVFGKDFDPSVLTKPLNYSASGQNTVWLDEVLRNAPMNNYELSARGGTDKTRFFISGGYYDQQGIVIESAYKRLGARMNIDHSVNDRFSIGANMSFNHSQNRRSFNDNTYSGIITNALGASPLMPAYEKDGNYASFEKYQANWLSDNPVKSAHELYGFTKSYRFLGSTFAEYKITNDLKFRSVFSTDFTTLNDDFFASPITTDGSAVGGKALNSSYQGLVWLNENILTYQKSFGIHNLSVLLGSTNQQNISSRTSIAGQGFPIGSGLQLASSAATLVPAPATQIPAWKLRSGFGRINYDIAGKYLFSATLRADASSRFSKNQRIGYFPSFSFGWNAHEEAFLKNHNTISFLRLRASYGVTGDQEIGNFQNTSLWKPARYLGVSGLAQRNLADPNLTWQKNIGTDVGIDIELWKGSLSASLDFYSANRKDLLSMVPIAGTTGFSSLITNGGEIQDKGVEFSITSRIIKTDDLKLSTSFNFTYQKNTIKSLLVDDELVSAYSDITPTHIMKVGESIGSFWGVKYLGVDTKTGSPMYEDLNKDGKIDADDSQIIGKARPDFFGGWTTLLSYKGLDASISFQFSKGNQVYNLIRPVYENLGYGNGGGLDQAFANNSTRVLNRWQKPGDVTDTPRFSFIEKNYIESSSQFVEDASFLRVKSLNIGYSFNAGNRKWFKSARLYTQAYNLFTFTKYSGFDPEVSSTGGNNDRTAGINYAAYPQPRTLTVGLNLGF